MPHSIRRFVVAALILPAALLAQRGGRGGGGGGPATLSPTASDPLAALRFRSVGPAFTSGRLADMAVDPKNPHIWYVATAAGGLWKTTNSGISFAPIFERYGSYSMCCVLVDPKNSNIIWLATGENTNLRSAIAGDGIYKSTDAGATWRRVGLERSEKIGRMAIDPRNSDVVYVASQGPLWAPGGDRGLYKTSDGGQSWKPVLQVSENTGITDVVLDPRNPDIIYAAAYQRRRNVGSLIGGGPEGGIYKSSDGGATFKKTTAGLPTVDIGRIALAISPQNPDVVYASVTAQGNQSGFFRSADRGETWVKQSDWNSNDPQYYGEIFPDPHHFDRVCGIATNNSCTNDGGKTFTGVNWSVHVDHHHIGFDPADSLHLWSGNDGGLYESFDNGRTWRHFQLPVTQFYRITVDNNAPFYNIYGGTQDNGSPGTPSRSMSPAGIRSNEHVSIGGGDGFQARADLVDNNIVYSSSQNGAISRLDKRTGVSRGISAPRVDAAGGRTRTAFEVPYIISPHNHNRLYVLTSALFRSDNQGDAWTAVTGDLTRHLDRDTMTIMGRKWGPDAVTKHLYTNDLGVGTALDESPLKAGLIYVGTDDGLIQVTDDAGKTWRKVESFPGVPALTFVSEVLASRHDTNTVYAAFNNMLRGDFTPYVLKSVDRGRTWTSIRANLPDRDQVWTLAEDHGNRNLLFAGTEHGVFATVDGGQNWRPLTAGLPTIAVRDIEIQRRENDLVLGTFGRGIYIMDDYSGLRLLAPRQGAAPAPEGALAPPRATRVYVETPFQRGGTGMGLFTGENPPFGALLSYTLRDAQPAGTEIVLTIKDATGKQVAQVTGPGAAGLNRTIWNLRGAPPPVAAAPARGAVPARGAAPPARGAAPPARGGRAAGGRGAAPPDSADVDPDAPGRGGRGGGAGGGALVAPGTFTVQLNRRTGGTLTPLGAAQRLQVIPL